MPSNDFAELAVFIAIAEEASFRRAAARLRLTPSTLSHSLRSLEDRLGVRLLNRTTRTVALTDAGAALLSEVGPAFRTVDAALERVNAFRSQPRGFVRINVPRLAADLLLAPRLSAFTARYPEVTLEVTVDDKFVDIIKDGYDAGIRLGESLDQDMTAVKLSGDMRGAVVGSPHYFFEHPKPRTPRDLDGHQCINRRHTGSGVIYKWEFANGSQRMSVSPRGPLVLNSDALMVRAALDGVGLAFISELDVAEHLAAGRLIRVLDGWCPPISGFYLYHSRNRNVPASLSALINALTAEPSKSVELGPGGS